MTSPGRADKSRLPVESISTSGVVQKNCAGIDLVKNRVVIHVPLNAGTNVAVKRARDDGRRVAGLGEEGDAGEIDRAVEYVALVRNQCPAERGIEEILLRDGEGEDFTGGSGVVVADVLSAADLFVASAEGVSDEKILGFRKHSEFDLDFFA